MTIKMSFGNYKKAKTKEIAIGYDGEINDADTGESLLDKFGLLQFVEYDKDNKLLKSIKELSKEQKQLRNSYLNDFGKEYSRDSGLYKTLTKLFFKDKYKRYDNKIGITIPLEKIKQAEKQHYKVKLSEIDNVISDNWWKSKEDSLKENLWLHIKRYEQSSEKFVVKI